MKDEAYSISLGNGEIRAPLQVTDVESAGEMIGTAVDPADAGERHPVTAPGHGAELGAGGRHVVEVFRAGPAGGQRHPSCQSVLRADRGAVGGVVVVVPEDGEGEIARDAGVHAPAVGDPMLEAQVADRAAEVLLVA